LCLLGAAISDAAAGGWKPAARRLALAGLLAVGAFILANPYSVLDFSVFRDGLSQQASNAGGAEPVKLGTTRGGGVAYYLWTFTWGIGWAPTLAAFGGAILLLVRRRWAMALVLLPAPIVFVLFMGTQQRYFGRWLMPILPIVAILAAWFTVEFVRGF